MSYILQLLNLDLLTKVCWGELGHPDAVLCFPANSVKVMNDKGVIFMMILILFVFVC